MFWGEKQNGRHLSSILPHFMGLFNGFISNKAGTNMWDKINTWVVTDTVYFSHIWFDKNIVYLSLAMYFYYIMVTRKMPGKIN